MFAAWDETISPSANSRLAGQTSLGVPKRSANSRVTQLKQGQSQPPLRLSVKNLCRLARTFAPGNIVSSWRRELSMRGGSISWPADFASSSPEAIENAKLLTTEGWGWGSPTVWQRGVGSDAFSRGDATEAGDEMLPQRQAASEIYRSSSAFNARMRAPRASSSSRGRTPRALGNMLRSSS